MFNRSARVRIQIVDGMLPEISYSAEPGKGDSDEMEALDMVENLANYFEGQGVSVRRMFRNMPEGEDRVDRIVVV